MIQIPIPVKFSCLGYSKTIEITNRGVINVWIEFAHLIRLTNK